MLDRIYWGTAQAKPWARVSRGTDGDALYTIRSGSVRVAMLSAEGVEATLAILRSGDSFGELALLDGEPRGATVVALTACRTLVVTRDAFERWLQEHPSVSGALLRALSQRVRRTDALLAELAAVNAGYVLEAGIGTGRIVTRSLGDAAVSCVSCQASILQLLPSETARVIAEAFDDAEAGRTAADLLVAAGVTP
ncbi:MAG: cyclic nucleotide-binding domain-containing protein [Proteobacteria bacterium]|nr:cyclic nucleotide-binding domain-containing protein [Pseudomonadota bacterium]